MAISRSPDEDRIKTRTCWLLAKEGTTYRTLFRSADILVSLEVADVKQRFMRRITKHRYPNLLISLNQLIHLMIGRGNLNII